MERDRDRSPDGQARPCLREGGTGCSTTRCRMVRGLQSKVAWVEGSAAEPKRSRSNLALVNTGEVDGSPSVFQHGHLRWGDRACWPTTVTGLRVAARRVASDQRHPGGLRSGNHPGLCPDQQDFRQQPLPGLRCDQRRRQPRGTQRRRRLYPGPALGTAFLTNGRKRRLSIHQGAGKTAKVSYAIGRRCAMRPAGRPQALQRRRQGAAAPAADSHSRGAVFAPHRLDCGLRQAAADRRCRVYFPRPFP